MSQCRRILWLIIATMLALGPSVGISAQNDQVERVRAENASLGSGCNPIGVAAEGPSAPIAPSQEWIDDHMACVESGVQTAAQCQGALQGDQRLEICALIVVQGDQTQYGGCEQFVLMTPSRMFGPDPQFTEEAMAYFQQTMAGINLPQANAVKPCTQSPVLCNGATVLAAFAVDRTEDDVVFRARVGHEPGEQVAFLVTDQRQEFPG